VLGAGERRIVESAALSAAATSPCRQLARPVRRSMAIMVRGLYLYISETPGNRARLLSQFGEFAIFTIDPKTPRAGDQIQLSANDASGRFLTSFSSHCGKPVKLP